jgi:hypothetical protein
MEVIDLWLLDFLEKDYLTKEWNKDFKALLWSLFKRLLSNKKEHRYPGF